jgi:predicted unusual protein kinase regulating ubiquinone biosynthesis (AarF/ABC1/UbiB family)
VARFVRVSAAIVAALVPWYLRDRGTPRSRAGISRRLRRQFESLGSTYVKLGQIISAFEGLFPDELVDEFKKLRDQVPPERFADVRAVVEADLGRPLETVLAEFAEEPLAAASLAQVHAAGLDTNAILRAGLIACLEGALIFGVFHGDLHGGNLLVQPSGQTVLFDFGITGRLAEVQRLAFLRLLLMGTSGDVRGQLVSLRDLGAFPPDTDLDAVYLDLELDQPVKDPTQMSADELVHEMQELVKKLLAYGARAPKDLMLFVKNLMFLNAATATLAPDLDLLGEIAHVHAYFLQVHGERLVRELGMDPTQATVDVDAVKASLLVPPEVERLTFRDLQERRRTILKRMGESRPRR